MPQHAKIRETQEAGLKDAAVAQIMTEKTENYVRPKDAENIRTIADSLRISGRTEIQLLEEAL